MLPNWTYTLPLYIAIKSLILKQKNKYVCNKNDQCTFDRPSYQLTLFLLSCPYGSKMVPFSKNFDFNFRRDHQKNSYESVDEKSLS